MKIFSCCGSKKSFAAITMRDIDLYLIDESANKDSKMDDIILHFQNCNPHEKDRVIKHLNKVLDTRKANGTELTMPLADVGAFRQQLVDIKAGIRSVSPTRII